MSEPKPVYLATLRHKTKQSELEEALLFHIRAVDLPAPLRELLFAPPREWRFDFAWPEHRLAVEIEGGTRNKSRHTQPQGFEDDCEKYNEACLLGWKLLRFTATMVNDGRAIATLERALTAPNNQA